MGDFSRTTFDRMKHYVGVRLQQGVPIVDADWNELEDIRKYELQAFLKWFVGDGVPAGNDGFRVAPLAGGGVGTIRLTSLAAGPVRSSVAIDIAASTAAATLGFAPGNRVTVRTGSPAQLTGDAAQPFGLTAGMTLVISAEGAANETVTFAPGAFANINAATASEVVAAINAAVTRVSASIGVGDDFTIMGGDGTPEGAGRCLVDGRDAITEGRLTYSSQPLFNNTFLATAWSVPVVAPLSAPPANREDLVYLDVWEREVTAAEDDALINPLIGVESCVRTRREWAVRVRAGLDRVPSVGDADFRAGHSYCALARLSRRPAVPAISTVTDLRPRSLLVPPSTLIEDVLGTSPDAYRRGENRPVTSLRDAINALLRGELPSSADTVLAPASAPDAMSIAFSVVGTDIVALWHSSRATNNQVYLSRWPLATPAAAATNLPVQLTPGPTTHTFPVSVTLPTGELVVAYETGSNDIFARRGTPSALAGAAEILVATGATVDRQPYAVLSGNLVVFFWQQVGATRNWMYRRWRHTDNTFIDVAPQQLSATSAAVLSGIIGDFSATVDDSGDIWAAFRADDGGGNFSIRMVRLRPSTLQIDEQTMSTSGANEHPYLLADGGEAVWVFWRSGTAPASSVSYQRIPFPVPAAWAVTPPPVAVTGSSAARPSAVRGTDGAVWLFWSQLVAPSTVRAIWLQRYLKNTNSWGSARQITGSTGTDDQPIPLIGPGGVVLLFWQSNRTGNLDLFTKQFITAI